MPATRARTRPSKTDILEHRYVRGSRPLLYGIPLLAIGVPIHIIPVELLSEIFLHLRDIMYSNASWTNVLAVCLRWYAVAVATGNLWSKINNKSKASTELHLQRSALCPLNIFIRTDPAQMPASAFTARLRPHISRIASVEVDFTCGNIQALFSRRGLPLHKLEHLRDLSLRLNLNCAVMHSRTVTLAVDKCPHIRTLELANIRITFATPKPLNLTRLSLTNPRDPPPVETLIAILRASPGLQEFRITVILGSWLPRRAQPQSALPMQDTSPAHMPNLKILQLNAGRRFTRQLLSMISCPSASIFITLTAACVHLVTAEFIRTAFPKDLSRLGSIARVDSLAIVTDSTAHDTSVLGFDHANANAHAQTWSPAFKLVVTQKNASPELSSTLEMRSRVMASICNFLCSVPLREKVDALVLDVPSAKGLSLDELFHCLRSLRFLRINSPDIDDCLSVFGCQDLGAQDPWILACKKLELLELGHVTFSEWLVESLGGWFGSRAAYLQRKFPELVIASPKDWSPEYLLRLRLVVDIVHCQPDWLEALMVWMDGSNEVLLNGDASFSRDPWLHQRTARIVTSPLVSQTPSRGRPYNHPDLL